MPNHHPRRWSPEPYVLSPRAVALATRQAPPVARLAVERCREHRGLPPLQADAIKSTPAVVRSDAAHCGVLVGLATAGTSGTYDRSADGTPRRWAFARGAFARWVEAGTRDAVLRIGHAPGGRQLAATADRTLRFKLDSLHGLVVVATLADDPRNRDLLASMERAAPGRFGLSVGFVDGESSPHEIDFLGQRLRIIREATLDHVALIVPGEKPGPRFPSTRVAAVRGTDPRDVARALVALCKG